MRINKYFCVLAVTGLVCNSVLAQPPGLNIDRPAGAARIWINGEAGRNYRLETTSDLLAPNGWSVLLQFTLTNKLQAWTDSSSAGVNQRFYRATLQDQFAPADLASNFRLFDHLGRSRELYYNSNVRAIVLIFAANGCASVQQNVSAIKTLNDQYVSQGVIFWMIDSKPQELRSNIVTEAASLGINFPILQDPNQIVARAYQAASTPEVIGISTADWTVFYRGAIDDRAGMDAQASTQSYLADALRSFLANQNVSPSQTRASGCAIDFVPKPTVSYAKDIVPLLENRCIRCHTPENIAPWSITNYAIVKAYAPAIKDEILSARMPPWHADPEYGKFANDSSLSSDEVRKLVQWIDDGAPRGDGPDPLVTAPAPAPPTWALGQPTSVLTIPLQNIPATGVVNYRYINVTTTFTNDVWLRAAVVRPGNAKVVHHCLVYFGTDSTLRGLGGFFAGYVPGYDPVEFPAGTGKFLPKGTVLQFQMHYTTDGQQETDQTQLGLYTMPAAPAHELKTSSVFNGSFVFGIISIPPGAPDYEMTAEYRFNNPVLLYEMSPHMHLRGSRFKYEAIYPNNTSEVLLSVPHYEFHWQTLYRLAQPKQFPAGTILRCTSAFDNSALNRDNPDPTKTVKFGEQTFDEMFIGYFNFAEGQ